MSKKQLILPRKDENGEYYISYSQITSWKAKRSFNLGIPGKLEYILSYFFGDSWPDMGWGTFGQEVEDYICEGKFGENFSDREKLLLDSIEPLGVFQKEIKINFNGFYLKGYIDDATKDFKKIRDYKTASLNSSKQYYGEDYVQLDIYSMWVKQEFGYYPDEIEVCIIERAGNCFRGGGRGVLSVKDNVWYHQRETNELRQKAIKGIVEETAEEISGYFAVFNKMLKY